MHKLISSCTKCGNPIYSCEFNQQTIGSSSTKVITSTHEMLPQILRTCTCKFDNELEKRIGSLEQMFGQIIDLLKDKREGTDDKHLPSDIDVKLLKD